MNNVLGKSPDDERLAIRVDTREQTPLVFSDKYVKTSVGTVAVFDYCLEGDSEFAIERKSLPDFVQSVVLSKSWIRELAKIAKAREWDLPVIYVLEFCFEDIADYDFSVFKSGNVKSQFVYRRVATLIFEYNVHLVFAGNRKFATYAICLLLKRRHEMLRLGNKL